MKRKILTAILAMAALGVNAQIEKGALMMGGSAGFSSSESSFDNGYGNPDQSENTHISVRPQVGYFVANGLALGISGSFSHYRYEQQGQQTPKYTGRGTGWSVGPFARYYYKLGNKAAIFGHANLGFGGSQSKSVYNSVGRKSPKSKYTEWAVGPGFAYFLTRNIGIEASMLYAAQKSKRDADASNPQTMGKDKALLLSLGFQIFLSRQE